MTPRAPTAKDRLHTLGDMDCRYGCDRYVLMAMNGMDSPWKPFHLSAPPFFFLTGIIKGATPSYLPNLHLLSFFFFFFSSLALIHPSFSHSPINPSPVRSVSTLSPAQLHLLLLPLYSFLSALFLFLFFPFLFPPSLTTCEPHHKTLPRISQHAPDPLFCSLPQPGPSPPSISHCLVFVCVTREFSNPVTRFINHHLVVHSSSLSLSHTLSLGDSKLSVIPSPVLGRPSQFRLSRVSFPICSILPQQSNGPKTVHSILNLVSRRSLVPSLPAPVLTLNGSTPKNTRPHRRRRHRRADARIDAREGRD